MKKTTWLSMIMFLAMGFGMAANDGEGWIPVSADVDLEIGTVVYLKFALFDRDGTDPRDLGNEVWSEQMAEKGVITHPKTVHLLGSCDRLDRPVDAIDFSRVLFSQVFYRHDEADPWTACSNRTRVPYATETVHPPTTIGEIKIFAEEADLGRAWMPCDGRFLNVEEFPALFGLIGTRYGGDGHTVFALPDLQGCADDRYFSGLSYCICVRSISTSRDTNTHERINKGNGGFKRVTRLDNHSGLEFSSGGVDYIGLNLLEHEDGVGTIWRAIPKNHDLESAPEEIRIVLAPDVMTPL